MGIFSIRKPTGKSNVYAILVGAFVLAASLGTVVYMQFQWNVQVKWQDSEYLFVDYRGPDGQIREPIFTEAMLSEYDLSLRTGITGTYELLHPPRKRFLVFSPQNDWVMGTSMQELFDGSLHMKVQAVDPMTGKLVKAWESTFEDKNRIAEGLEPFTKHVATELGELKDTAGSGG